MSSSRLGLLKKVLFSLVPCLALVVALEGVQRIRYFGFTGKVFYLNLSSAFSDPDAAQRGPHLYAFKAIFYNRDRGGGYYKGAPGKYLHRFRDSAGNLKTVEYTINSLGFRSPEFAPRRGKGVVRVIAVGGSSTMGLESPDGQTFPALLQRKLEEKFPQRKYEVINAGFVGYYSKHVLNLVRDELVSYDPDMILMYSAYNDTAHERHIVRKTGRPWWMKTVAEAHDVLYRRSLFYMTAVERVSLWKTGNPVPAFEFSDRFREAQRENVLGLIRVCRERGVKLVFILQPLSLADGLSPFLSGMSADGLEALVRTKGFFRNAQAAQAIRQKVLLAQLLELAKTYKISVVNPLVLFEERRRAGKRLFEDIVHLTPEGNALLAEFVAGSAAFGGAPEDFVSNGTGRSPAGAPRPPF